MTKTNKQKVSRMLMLLLWKTKKWRRNMSKCSFIFTIKVLSLFSGVFFFFFLFSNQSQIFVLSNLMYFPQQGCITSLRSKSISGSFWRCKAPFSYSSSIRSIHLSWSKQCPVLRFLVSLPLFIHPLQPSRHSIQSFLWITLLNAGNCAESTIIF